MERLINQVTIKITSCVLGAVVMLFTVTSRAGGDGSGVGNGGGLSEQSILYSSLRLRSLLAGCQKYSDCGQRPPQSELIQNLLTCRLPESSDLAFSIPAIDADLFIRPYVRRSTGQIILNREMLNDTAGLPLRVPAAAVYLARIYADDCKLMRFTESVKLLEPLAAFVARVGEQLTIGKDSIHLPMTERIHVRSVAGDLLFESAIELTRLSCPMGRLDSCTVGPAADEDSAAVSFKNLSLTLESLADGVVHFEIEANVGTQTAHLKGNYRSGSLMTLTLDGRKLTP